MYSDVIGKYQYKEKPLKHQRRLRFSSQPTELWSKVYHHETCLYNVDPIKTHFYIVKLGFTGVYIIFLSFARKHRL